MLRKGYVINAPVFIGAVSNMADEIILKCQSPRGSYVCVANVHMVTTATWDRTLKSILNNAFLVTPDGLPLVWVLRQHGEEDAARVTGTDLAIELCRRAETGNIPIGFYGSSDVTISALKKRLTQQYPKLNISFCESPPELPLHPVVDRRVVDRINQSGAKMVFIGLGCPKQEYWMSAYAPHLSAVLIGIGAAFNFISGTVQRAPVWMQNSGLEWLHRLCAEPGKTWKRYATTNPVFVWLVMKEYLNRKHKPRN